MSKRGTLRHAALAALLLPGPVLANSVLVEMLAEWQADAEQPFTAAAGENLWFVEQDGRSCTLCHTDSVHTEGRHQRTGKVIEPMAPSVNPERYTDRKKINKWLLRNCKWTFGRECTAQEKGDVLTWLRRQ